MLQFVLPKTRVWLGETIVLEKLWWRTRDEQKSSPQRLWEFLTFTGASGIIVMPRVAVPLGGVLQSPTGPGPSGPGSQSPNIIKNLDFRSPNITTYDHKESQPMIIVLQKTYL